MNDDEILQVSDWLSSYAESLGLIHDVQAQRFRKAAWAIHNCMIKKPGARRPSTRKDRDGFVFLEPCLYARGWFGWYRCFSREDGTDPNVRRIKKLFRRATYDDGKLLHDSPWTTKDFETLNVPKWCSDIAGQYDAQVGSPFRRMGRAAHRLSRQIRDIRSLNSRVAELTLTDAVSLARHGRIGSGG